MAITIDEVTAEVAPPERGSAPAVMLPDQRQDSPAEARKQMERLEQIKRRTARVCAN
jgi:hypothetical protein